LLSGTRMKQAVGIETSALLQQLVIVMIDWILLFALVAVGVAAASLQNYMTLGIVVAAFIILATSVFHSYNS